MSQKMRNTMAAATREEEPNSDCERYNRVVRSEEAQEMTLRKTQ